MSPIGPRFQGISQMTFRQGSVIANYVLEFSDPTEPISTDIVSGIMKLSAENDNFGNYTVAPDSIVHSIPEEPTTATPTQSTEPQTVSTTAEVTVVESKELPNWAIAVIACGSAVLIFLLVLIWVLCRRRHVTHKYALPEDPDDIGYRRNWASNNTQHNPDYVYDNKLALQDDGVAESGEVKNPVAYYNLNDTDLKEGNGRLADEAASAAAQDPTLINVHDWPPANGSPNRAVLYFYDNTRTVYDQSLDSFETRL
ncbi:hypothetical protein ACF0H5_024359 [Mactra antiquata]